MSFNSLTTPPANFISFNNQLSKQLVVVCDIDGLPLLGSLPIQRFILYGEQIVYGGAGLVYGGLVALGSTPSERQQRNYLMRDGGALTISQKLEPEQGRGSISTLSLSFLDKDGYMTKAVTPGQVVAEILGLQMKLWIGYLQSSWPEDYYVVWRGRVGQINTDPGRITMQFVDPNVIRRQQVFYCGQTTLSGAHNSGTTTISVAANGNFFKKITGPDGSYDGSVRVFIKIDDEFIEYQQTGNESTGYGTDQFLNVARGVSPVDNMATPSAAAAHADGATVDGYIMLTDHAMNIALKIMMSGWNGPYKSSQAI